MTKKEPETVFVFADEIPNREEFEKKVQKAFQEAPCDVPGVVVDNIIVPNRVFFD